ncbi:MAG: DUF1538 family protein [Betaproteobacteria bacterium]
MSPWSTGGLALFLLGVRLGLLEVGEYTGVALPKTGKVWVVVLLRLLLGFVVTVVDGVPSGAT